MKRPQAGRSDRDGLGSGNGCDSNPAAELRASRVSGRPGPAARERVCDVGKDSGPGEKEGVGRSRGAREMPGTALTRGPGAPDTRFRVRGHLRKGSGAAGGGGAGVGRSLGKPRPGWACPERGGRLERLERRGACPPGGHCGRGRSSPPALRRFPLGRCRVTHLSLSLWLCGRWSCFLLVSG